MKRGGEPHPLTFEPGPCCDALGAAAEAAGLEATRVNEQILLDGWIVRFAPSRAKRLRCINPLGNGSLDLDEKIARVKEIYAQARLPLIFRITPFSAPGLDRELALRGYAAFEETRVMIRSCDRPSSRDSQKSRPELISSSVFAEESGKLNGDTREQIAAAMRRVADLPQRSSPLAIRKAGETLALGSMQIDGDMAGIYGLQTRFDARRRGYASQIIDELIRRAEIAGARHVCLQVGASNEKARRLYAKFGFIDRYAYWYR